MLTYLYAFFNDGIYLIKTNQKFTKKLKYFYLFTKIWVKNSLPFNFKKEKLFGKTLKIPNYDSFCDMFRELFIHNNYYADIKSEKPVIIDCGANIGIATIFFKSLYPNSKIYSYEPDPNTFSILKENLKGYNNIVFNNEALSNKKGSIKFYVSSKETSGLGMSVFKRQGLDKSINVKTVLLSDKITSKVDILKLDIEGSEEFVLDDLLKSKKIRYVERMLIEYHHKIDGRSSRLGPFLDMLEKAGFEYQLDTRCIPLFSENRFQDILIYAYRSK